MLDDHHPLMPRRSPEDIDLGAIKTDLAFLIERVSRLPTRTDFTVRSGEHCNIMAGAQ